MKKKNIFLMTCFILLMAFFVIPKGTINTQASTRTRLNYTSLKMAQGKTTKIKVIGKNGRRVKWTNNNPKITPTSAA